MCLKGRSLSAVIMERTSAACAMEWSIDLEKGLRSKKLGEDQSEMIDQNLLFICFYIKLCFSMRFLTYLRIMSSWALSGSKILYIFQVNRMEPYYGLGKNLRTGIENPRLTKHSIPFLG